MFILHLVQIRNSCGVSSDLLITDIYLRYTTSYDKTSHDVDVGG